MLIWSALLIPPQAVLLALKNKKFALVLPRLWHRGACRLYNIKVNITGRPGSKKQTLFICNHVSYLDIMVIGSVIEGCFIAKQEVAAWPYFGLLARLQKTAFISRRPKDVHDSVGKVATRLAEGHDLILFPEGTSTNGKNVLPFRTGLFDLVLSQAADRNFHIRPVTIEITKIGNDCAITDQTRDGYAWYADMTLLPHLWAFAKSAGAEITLHFHKPVEISQFTDRKDLAKHCHNVVLSPLEDHDEHKNAGENHGY